MRRAIIGDIHGRMSWQLLPQNFDEYIFIGDFFDSFDIKGDDQINNFLNIMAWKKKMEEVGKKVICLIGNHDDPSYIYDGNVSGYQRDKAHLIKAVLEEHKDDRQMAYSFDDVLCTHAGVGEYWLERQWKAIHRNLEFPETAKEIADFVNEIWKYKPHEFRFTGVRSPYGDEMSQTPVWIRPTSLMRGNQFLKDKIVQVVGHTGMQSIDIEGKSTGGRYYFIDTVSVREYLIWEDGVFKKGRL